MLEQMVTPLKPLQVATAVLCEAEIVCVSLVCPIINSKHLTINDDDLPM